ncbi:MAG: porin [Geobacteraceae bacterium]|nr:porin [Geobacteraceae bacterium]
MSKRLLSIAAALAACVLVGQGAQAKTLEDILKEKGVITEADYKEVTKSKPFDYKLGKGFTFTSADEKFQLSIGGRMQFRYTFMDNDGPNTDTSSFNAQRIRLIAQGYAYSKDFTYKLEIDPKVLSDSSGNNSRGGLLDCFINYKFMNELQLLVGQTKVKYGYTMVQADANLMFVDRVPWISRMVPGYELGAFAYGNFAKGLVDYALSVTNGDGQTYAASTNHNAFAARVALSPLGKMANDEPDLAISKKPVFTVGANYLYNNLNSGENWGTYGTWATTAPAGWNNNRDIQNYGFDAHFKWMGLALQGEALFSQGVNKDSNVKRCALGWYGQAGYMITPKIGVAFRYSQFDPNRGRSNDLQSEQIGAVSYYFDKHNLKLQADVGNIHDQSSTNRDAMQYRMQAQLVF